MLGLGMAAYALDELEGLSLQMMDPPVFSQPVLPKKKNKNKKKYDM